MRTRHGDIVIVGRGHANPCPPTLPELKSSRAVIPDGTYRRLTSPAPELPKLNRAQRRRLAKGIRRGGS